MAHQLEYVISGEAEKLLGRPLADVALESLDAAAALGLPIRPVKTSGRGVAVYYGGRRAYFRVVAVLVPSGGYSICLRRYTLDCGEVAYVGEGGKVERVLLGIPAYLSSPGELYNGHVADVWMQRFKAVLSRGLAEVRLEELPAGVRRLLEEVAEREGLAGFARAYYVPATLDYALGLADEGVLPVWVSSTGLGFSVSERGMEKLREKKTLFSGL